MKGHNVGRKSFYQGQHVTPLDMNGLQDYTDSSHANLVTSLLGRGVVHGLDVNHLEGHVLEVSTGLAYDSTGERLHLKDGKQLDLSYLLPNSGEKVIKIGMVLDYEKTDPATDSLGNMVYTTWTPTVGFVTDEVLDEKVFELAEVTINSLSIIEIVVTAQPFLNLAAPENFFTKIQDILYPIGYQYTQVTDPNYINEQGNVDFNPAHVPSFLFGGVWQLIWNGSGAFERYEGGLSAESRQNNGIQLDAMARMTGAGYIPMSAANNISTFLPNQDGVFRGYSYARNASGNTYGNTFYNYNYAIDWSSLSFDNARQVRTSSENRPLNILKRTWLRIV